ncbi:hypothetical protein CcI49_14205 [Frankia sp. CcI49]|uniref:FXSXX-COOH protein n=1 Tax=Parafrankia irregularis TaxID=795642 RepID=A0A0S4QR64_9ACTN|nr:MULTISPECIES: hypothetical protein [Frankiaceae]KPM52414.1 hypothetical protein ACG83_29025 [Frankia sp. R43]MBE3205938.1 hypothetical protein [Parafrankia sp. CH37]ONH59876.1 hypothetical protein CcI49_14205 [Frankia sp. CcI49]CUU58113.1 hypothetical protein Ga0074812_11722 [Parafrankia irregularis]
MGDAAFEIESTLPDLTDLDLASLEAAPGDAVGNAILARGLSRLRTAALNPDGAVAGFASSA